MATEAVELQTAGQTSTFIVPQEVPSAAAASAHDDFRASTNDVSAAEQIKLITWKNFQTEVRRRKCSCCCKFCCPIFFMLIMGVVGLMRPFFTYTVNCDADSFSECPDIYYGEERHAILTSLGDVETRHGGSFIPSLICRDDEYIYDDTDDGWTASTVVSPPPRYLAVVYDSSDAGLVSHVDAVMSIIGEHYGDGQDYNISDIDDDDFRCSEWSADTANINFTLGSLLAHFESEAALTTYMRDEHYGMAGWTAEKDAANGALRPIAAAIVFKSVSADGLHWDYVIRMNESSVPPTFADNEFKIVDRHTKDAEQLRYAHVEPYLNSGFLELQTWLDLAITAYIAQLSDIHIELDNSRNQTYLSEFMKGYFVFPFAPYQSDVYWSIMQIPFRIFVTIMFIWPIVSVVGVLVTDKATKVKEGMKIMGATPCIYWSSMYLWFALEFTLICVCVVIVGFLMNIFLYSSAGVIFVWFWLFCLSQMSFATLLTAFFDDSKTAIICMVVLYFVQIIGLPFAMQSLNAAQKRAICLLAAPCFIESVNVVTLQESSLVGVQWGNLNEEFSQFSMATCLAMMFVDVFLYTLLTLYLDNVWPSRLGQKSSVVYCLYPSYWRACSCCCKRKSGGQLGAGDGDEDADVKKLGQIENYEDVGSQDPMIKVRKLRKTFQGTACCKGNEVTAVDDVDLDIYNGEVFCLLGHNGAGKTTAISMLSGLLSSTAGDAFIAGYNVNHSMNNIRKFLGVCPQHDVLWDRMTTEEHLRFFAKLKGVSNADLQNELNRVINLFNMLDNGLWGKFPSAMSGGEKRRLSLAIAMIGGSQIVFLDEPTSGMDPENRRHVWDIIQREKKNRCIILTTHYMDEADILGDRIAIMSGGQIKCCGSSLYLKRLYGVGYTFTVSLQSGVNIEDEKDAPLKTEIDAVIHDILGAKTTSIAATEILYRLPFESSGQFAEIFKKLDDHKTQLQIETFGVSVTTLEEVFLKINETAAVADDEEQKEEREFDHNIKFEQSEFQLTKRNACSIFIIHVYAILYKRFWWGVRDIKGLLCQILLPLVFVALLFGLSSTIEVEQKELLLSPLQFSERNQFTESVVVPVSTLESTTSDVSNLFYTDDHAWMAFYQQNMQDGYGEVLPLSIGRTNRSCLASADSGNSGDYGYYSYGGIYQGGSQGAQDNCTAEFQLAINRYKSDVNTPYFGFYFLPWSYWSDDPTVDSQSEVLFGVNASAYHSLPIAYNTWNNWVLRNLYDGDVAGGTAQINVYSNPFPLTKQQESEQTVVDGISTSINLLIAFTLIPATSIFFVVNEKTVGTKHQQFVSGISIVSYWLGTFISDILLGLPATAFVIVLVYIFDVEAFKGPAAMPFFVTLLGFVASSIAAGYLLHFFFKSAGKAQFVVILCNILIGISFAITTGILDSIGNPSADNTSSDMKSVIRVLPIYLLTENIQEIVNKPARNPMASYWDMDITQRNIWYMVAEAVGYFVLTLLVEYAQSFPALLARLGFVVDQPKKAMRLDEDVLAEQARIKQAVDAPTGNYIDGVLQDSVILAGLRKVYKGENKFGAYNPAVRDMFFGVKLGEVFGFLGVNGAGKTSTLNMLTGNIYPSSGIAYIDGKSVVTEQLHIRRHIGFCPQNDALFDLLSAREHLKFYALIKGLSGSELSTQVDTLLTALTLNEYANRTAVTYSGGNKRKLCVAQAMIGNPPVVFLDEPSTGMDPVSRRFMWKFINQTMAGRAVILTTHSMEECEALCNRVGIMVAGQLSCIGSPQHLKSKFGPGYQLDITLKEVERTSPMQSSVDGDGVADGTDEETSELVKAGNNGGNNVIYNLLEEFNQHFATTILQQNGTKLLLEIRQYDADDTVSKLSALGNMFEFVEKQKEKYGILSYALSQTSLEQIFLKMAARKGEVEAQVDISQTQRELLTIIRNETKDNLLERLAVLNRDHLEKILENEIKNGSQYVVKALHVKKL